MLNPSMTGRLGHLFLLVALVWAMGSAISFASPDAWAGTAQAAEKNAANPCAAKANPCAAKANPCSAKANPCAAKANPCSAKANPCAPKAKGKKVKKALANPCAAKK